MTKKPAPDARHNPLHKRLTVAFANAADRARLLEVIAGDLGVAGPDGSAALLRSEDLWQAADVVAGGRIDERREQRSELDGIAARMMHDCDTAQHQLEHLLAWQHTIVEGAAWATDLNDAMPDHLDAVEASRADLDQCRADQRSFQHDLDRVLEQRTAAAAAIEEADRELGDLALAGSSMDESALRRELEGAGEALRTAEDAHAAALGKLEELQIEASGLVVRREAAETPGGDGAAADAAAVDAVRAALVELHAVSIENEVDADAVALAEAWRDLHLDLQQVAGPGSSATELDIDAARRRVAAASADLLARDSVASTASITPDDRAALDAAHAEVLAAEEQVIGRRRVGAAARQRLDEAHAAERVLLDQHGFGGYLDVVLGGVRPAPHDPARAAAEREHFEAVLALDALERSTQSTPELRHLESERLRLLGMATDLLLVDPGDCVDELLRSHAPAPVSLRITLADALAEAGIHPVGNSLESAAISFLERHPVADDDHAVAAAAADERRIELAAVEARVAALEGELVAAETEVAHSGDALKQARRRVDSFEGELTVRAGEDMPRVKRFAAAEQLRAQIDAVAGTLRRAEDQARQDLERAGREVAAAESAFEQMASNISDFARRARKLAEELPIHKRPEGDPLETLRHLAQSLVEHAEVLQPEIDKVAVEVDGASLQLEEALEACRVANARGDGVHPEDLTEGLIVLLEDGGPLPLVIDEPFVGSDASVRADLLKVVWVASEERQIVLLTEDAEILSWAIELPIEEATALPAEALLTRIRHASHSRLNSASPEADATEPTVATAHAAPATDVDITTSATIDTDHEATPSVRRWAGQR